MNILLTGASGLLGRSLMGRLSLVGKLTGLAQSRAKAPLVRLDLTDEASVRAAFSRLRPDLVVHAAAERRPDVVDGDPKAAEKLNVGATALLAQLCSESGARLVYVSTDYVFDGSAPPYRVDSPTNPLNAYGRMKLAGEAAVRDSYAAARQALSNRWAIVRIPILYGLVESLAESPVTDLAAKVFAGKPFKAENWASRYPAHADDVARAIVLICDCLAEGTGGIYHFAGAEMLTKYEMARCIAVQFGFNPDLIDSDSNPPAGAPRPKDCRLDDSSLRSLGFVPSIAFADGIRAALAPFAPVR